MNYLNYIEDHIEVWKSFMFLIFKVVKIDLLPSLSLLLTLINYRVCVWLHVRQALSSSSIKLSYVGLDRLDTPIVSTI